MRENRAMFISMKGDEIIDKQEPFEISLLILMRIDCIVE